MFPFNDLTSQLHLLHHHQQHQKQDSDKNSSSLSPKAPSSSTKNKKEQIFDAALRTLDDAVRESCQDAKKAMVAAVRATRDQRHPFVDVSSSKTQINNKKKKIFRATSHHPLSEDINLSIELCDGRLIAACSAAQQLAGAVAKTASTLKVRTDDFVYHKDRWPDRIDYNADIIVDDNNTNSNSNDDDPSSSSSRSILGFSSSTIKAKKNENSLAIKHVAVAVQCLSQMASEARVCLAVAKDEAERVRLQRLKFAKCGVIVNPMDTNSVVAANSTLSASADILQQGSRLLEKNTQEQAANNKDKNNKFLKNLTTGTEDFLNNSAVGKASNEIFSKVVKKAQDSGVSATSVFSGFGSVFDNVSRFATETTDRFVDNVILGKDDDNDDDEENNSIKQSTSVMRKRHNGTTSTNAATGNNNNDMHHHPTNEEEIKRNKKRASELKSLTSPIRLDHRNLGEYAKKMNSEGKSLMNWKEMAQKQNNNNMLNNNNDFRATSGSLSQHHQQEQQNINYNDDDVENRLGLRQEHEGLQHKFTDESATAAKEVERSIQELGRMTTILQEQVSLQTEQLLVIEKNTDESVSNMDRAQQELEKHDLDKFWTFKRILAAIICAHTMLLLVLHFIIR